MTVIYQEAQMLNLPSHARMLRAGLLGAFCLWERERVEETCGSRGCGVSELCSHPERGCRGERAAYGGAVDLLLRP